MSAINTLLMAKLSKLYTKKQIDAIRADLIAKHGNFCQICAKPREAFKNNLSVDHNHKSGKIRGLLCFRCNKYMLGRHTIESVEMLLAYLLAFDVRLNR